MGLLDGFLKKATQTITENIKDTIEEKLGSNNNYSNSQNTTEHIINDFTVPERYNEFPKYEGNIVKNPIEKETDKYYRITIRYNGSLNQEFINKLIQNGFIQGSSVRYDKGNTYVIVSEFSDQTEIVYHVKK